MKEYAQRQYRDIPSERLDSAVYRFIEAHEDQIVPDVLGQLLEKGNERGHHISRVLPIAGEPCGDQGKTQQIFESAVARGGGAQILQRLQHKLAQHIQQLVGLLPQVVRQTGTVGTRLASPASDEQSTEESKAKRAKQREQSK